MSSKPKTRNDKAWEALFSEHKILEKINTEGEFIISAPEIKKYREPRLMAKFDHYINLPQVFSDNKLSILPISRGGYIISHFEAYQPFESPGKAVTRLSLPAHLQSLDPHNISSETIAVNCALASGMLADFLEDNSLYATVSGRMGSGEFAFKIKNSKLEKLASVQVKNSQIEIDAALEGKNTLALLEVKCDLSADFLVRQLYYPFRMWESRVAKKVKPIFLVYSNGIYSFYEYKFEDSNVYNSLILVNKKNYSIEDTKIEISEIDDIKNQITSFKKEPEIPFPQADSFERIINICELLKSQTLTREEVTEEYAFDIRQTHYYTEAAHYLGLVEKPRESRTVTYKLSKLGEKIMQLNYKQRQLAFCRCILEHKVFSDVFALCQQDSVPDKNEIVRVMKRCNLYRLGSETTHRRRASTISSWVHWILGLTRK